MSSNNKEPKAHYPTIGELMNQIGKGVLNIDPIYQRFEKWSPIKGKKYISNLLNSDCVLQPITIAGITEKKRGEEVVDGKQRLTKIRKYFKSAIFRKKSEEERDDFLNTRLVVLVYPKLSLPERYELFENINFNNMRLSWMDRVRSQRALPNNSAELFFQKFPDTENGRDQAELAIKVLAAHVNNKRYASSVGLDMFKKLSNEQVQKFLDSWNDAEDLLACYAENPRKASKNAALCMVLALLLNQSLHFRKKHAEEISISYSRVEAHMRDHKKLAKSVKLGVVYRTVMEHFGWVN